MLASTKYGMWKIRIFDGSPLECGFSLFPQPVFPIPIRFITGGTFTVNDGAAQRRFGDVHEVAPL